MIDRVGDLFRGQTDVYRLQNGPHHRNGKVGLQEPIAVPVKDADCVASLDAELAQGRGEPPDPLSDLAIGETRSVAINDFLIR